MASSYYRGQGNQKKKKKDPWDPLKHLDDARAEWEKRKKEESEEQPPEKDEVEEQPPKEKKAEKKPPKLAEGLAGISESLSQDDEAESTLESVSKIVDAAAIIKRTFDNNKKLGEETEDVTIEDVKKDFIDYNNFDPFVDFSELTDDSSISFFKQAQILDQENPTQHLLAKIVGTNKLNSRGSQHEITYNHYITEIQNSQTPEDTLPDYEDDINPQDPDWKTPNQAWLDDTANSPAAKAGLSDALRLQAKERHDQFKADRQKPEETTEKIEETTKTDNIDVEKDTSTIFQSATDDDKKKFNLLGNMRR